MKRILLYFDIFYVIVIEYNLENKIYIDYKSVYSKIEIWVVLGSFFHHQKRSNDLLL